MPAPICVLAASALLVSGCADGAFDWSFLFRKAKPVVDQSAPQDPLADSAAYRDTVAEYAYFDGLRRLRVRSYGIVAGLGDKGSSQVPQGIADQLIQEMYKRREFASRSDIHLSPERLLRDKDTAVVTVEGDIPAAASAESRFDLVVRALPGTDTESLEGGTLYECDLQIFKPSAAGGWIPGKTVARGWGPVFLNPFGRSEEAATRSDPRGGMVIGGGRSQDDRRLRLLLTAPSYQMAIRIADAVNERFASAGEPLADAVSPGEVRLTVPELYRDDPKHFVAVVQHLYPLLRPEMLAQRARELGREFEKPDAPHVEIALAWEAIGRSALPEVQRFYADARPACSFYAAAAGLLMGDDLAVETVADHLMNEKGRYRSAALRALGAARNSSRAARPLRRALDDGDARIRTVAYEALVARGDPRITEIEVAGAKFWVDLVASQGPPLVYVKRQEQARIALFGHPLEMRPPLFYAAPDDSLIIDAGPLDDKATVVRRGRVSGLSSPPIEVGLDVAGLLVFLGEDAPTEAAAPVRGVGYDYAGIARLLSKMCGEGMIGAPFLLETPEEAYWSKPSRPPGRREADF